ncbi:MAG: cytochrome P450, partial [Planctomycetales bacterium]|nr:cytochrome P450 [Planctomycetales bacterium]NIP69292.1 cytochrome P450 [Planctomycetales bacterium]
KPILGQGLFLSEGDLHRRQRRLVQPALGRTYVANYVPVITDFCQRTSQGWREGSEIEMAREMLDLTLPIVTKALFHVQLDAETADIRQALTTVIEHFNRFLAPSAGWLGKLPTPRNVRCWRAQQRLDQIVFQLIRASRRQTTSGDDVLSRLLRAQDHQGDGRGMSDRQVRDEVMTLLVAGHETVATALTWTWYLLSQNPAVEARLHQEWDQVLEGRTPQIDDLPQLQYTKMVLAESMRIYPPVWALSRVVTQDYPVRNYLIPAGSIVGVSQYVAHRDERYFGEPGKFDPLRWTEQEKAKRPKFSYFPFGGGPRLCIGEAFAWMEMILILATLGQQWRPRLVPGHPVELLPLVTLRPKHGMRMTLEPRPTGSDSTPSRKAVCV